MVSCMVGGIFFGLCLAQSRGKGRGDVQTGGQNGQSGQSGQRGQRLDSAAGQQRGGHYVGGSRSY